MEKIVTLYPSSTLVFLDSPTCVCNNSLVILYVWQVVCRVWRVVVMKTEFLYDLTKPIT